MADISSITLPDGNTYNFKDSVARLVPIETRTYENVIAATDETKNLGFFYMKVRGATYDTTWHVKLHVHATVPGKVEYDTDTTYDIWGKRNGYSVYECFNIILNTSYRPIYYNSAFFVSSSGYTNNCGTWLGFSLASSQERTNTSYKRTIVVELLQYENCTVEFSDTLYTSTNIPNRSAHTGWYTSTETSYTNFDAGNQGLKQNGDANTTSISNLLTNNGTYVADSAIYRYQLLFQKDENALTPLNNANNTTGTSKTMLTNVEFDPFGRIFYYNSTTTISAGNNIAASAQMYAASGFDLRLTLNCGSTLTAQKPLYLVVTPTTNGKCKIASTTPWAQTLPSTDDGNMYILLGRTYSTYQMALYPYHPVYMYRNGKVRKIASMDLIPMTAAEVSSAVTAGWNGSS